MRARARRTITRMLVHISEIKGINPLELFDPSNFLSLSSGSDVHVCGGENYIYKGVSRRCWHWRWVLSVWGNTLRGFGISLQVSCSLKLVGSRFPLSSHFSTLCSLWNKNAQEFSLKEVSAGDINFCSKRLSAGTRKVIKS